jgi:hypothetical protein
MTVTLFSRLLLWHAGSPARGARGQQGRAGDQGCGACAQSVLVLINALLCRASQQPRLDRYEVRGWNGVTPPHHSVVRHDGRGIPRRATTRRGAGGEWLRLVPVREARLMPGTTF